MTVLQVVVASGGKCAALVTGAKGTTMLYYASTSELNTYWQLVFPNRPYRQPYSLNLCTFWYLSTSHTIYAYYISLRSLGKKLCSCTLVLKCMYYCTFYLGCAIYRWGFTLTNIIINILLEPRVKIRKRNTTGPYILISLPKGMQRSSITGHIG